MRHSTLKQLFKNGLVLVPYVLLAIFSVPIIGISLTEGSKLLGLRKLPVPVVGTGSMYPSLFWSKSEGGPEDDEKVVIEEYRSTPHLYRRFKGFQIFGKSYLKRTISRGDMVAFQNDKTKEILSQEGKDGEAGFIKRVIAIPGDKIKLSDGFVYLNDQLISEPYISLARSTYGGDFLKDCQDLVIPANKYFVLGDNRKVSADSRFELGLVDDNDIEYILPLSEQQIYHSLWRDTTKDDDQLGQPTLVNEEFLSLVNNARSSKKIAKLKTVQSLIKSSTKRGEKLLLNQNTSYSMKQAISDAGYTNIVLGEFVSHGHFSAKELLENLLYNPATAKQILNSDFSDLGVSAVNLNVDGCPSQIIVGHLGGYLPAHYDQSTIDSWKALSSNLSQVIPSWESAVGDSRVDQAKLSSLLSILYRRLELAKEIVATIEKSDWLTDSQQSRIKTDEQDAKQAELLVKEMNGQ